MTEKATRAQSIFAYGGALTMVPYLLIKISWVCGALLGLLPHDQEFSLAGWVLLNLATIVMSAVGIGLALALVRPWGRRLPAWPLLGFSWIGSGFLVPLLPYLIFSSLALGVTKSDSTDQAAMPNWEAALIEISFLGLALGLAVALPFYLRQRWPQAFTGTLGSDPDGHPSIEMPHRMLSLIIVGAALASATLGLYWTAGGTLGLSHPESRDLMGQLLTASSAIWTMIGAGAVWILRLRRPVRLPLWIPVMLIWLTSGLLFAWSAWKLPLTVFLAIASPANVTWPENLAFAAGQDLLNIAISAAMLILLRRSHLDRTRPRPADDVGTDNLRPPAGHAPKTLTSQA